MSGTGGEGPLAAAIFARDFERNDEFRQLGAGLAVYERGARVLDRVGGFADAARTRLWDSRTLVNIWSASKGIIAVAIAQLVERRLLDYQAPVARYWPDFAQNGKGAITVDDVLSHRSGLNGFFEPTAPEDLYDWDLITGRLARQAPLWPPRSAVSYHGMTFGYLAGELIRRVTSLRPRDYVRVAIAEPLGADLHLGVPIGREADVAEIVPPLADRNPAALPEIAAWTTRNPRPDPAAPNDPAWQKSEIPAVNIHATADGLARVYAALANRGELDGVRLLSPEAIAGLRRARPGTKDEMLGRRIWGAGVARNATGIYGPNPEAFGHSGWGGSFGAADPDSGRAVGFVLNRMGSNLNGDPRAVDIAKAAFGAKTGGGEEVKDAAG